MRVPTLWIDHKNEVQQMILYLHAAVVYDTGSSPVCPPQCYLDDTKGNPSYRSDILQSNYF